MLQQSMYLGGSGVRDKWAWAGTDVRPKVPKPIPFIYMDGSKKGSNHICRQYKVVYAQNIPHFATEQVYVA